MNKPIRILHVLQRMEAGGTQALLMNLYRNIDRTQIQFDFLVEYEEKQFYDDEILNMGGNIYYSNVRKDKNVFKFQKYLRKILKENDYKIIHVHAYTIGYFALKVAEECGVPIRIAHSHSNSMTNDAKKIFKLLLKKVYTIHATDYMACSEAAGKFLFDNKDYTILPNGIDAKKFVYNEESRIELRKEFGIDNNFVIGHVGRFKPEKNHIFLIDVFMNIKKSKPNSKLLLVGNGDFNNEILEKIKNNNLDNDVIILKNRKDVNKIYSAMDVFIFPSLYEGLGIVAIEAQTSGLQVFASDTLPKEVEVTNNIFKLSLKDNSDIWSQFILNNYNDSHKKDIYDLICSAGFDINSSTKMLTDYYLKKIGEINE